MILINYQNDGVYKQMLITHIAITCSQRSKQIEGEIIDKNKIKIRNKNKILESYKQFEQTYNNNKYFLNIIGVIK